MDRGAEDDELFPLAAAFAKEKAEADEAAANLKKKKTDAVADATEVERVRLEEEKRANLAEVNVAAEAERSRFIEK